MHAIEPPAAVCYYVYYRLAADTDLGAARERVHAMQRQLHKHTGVAGRLLERCNDPHTWMEIYAKVDDPGFEHTLQREVEAAGLERLIEPGSNRHVERFVECA